MNIFNKAQKDVSSQSDKTEKSVHSLDDAFRAISPSTLSAVAGITALIGAVKGLTNAFSSAISNYAHFEKMQMGLTTFFQDADKGKQKFEELRKLSNETTFGVDELTDSFTQLANVGVNVDTIKDKLIMLGNVAQGDKQKFAELVSIYSKVQSTGKAGAMQIQQLAMRGIPIYDMLKKIGVQGTATGEDITRAFQEMTKEGGQFYNAMNNINQTIEGKQGFISDYLKEMSVNFAEVTGLADAYKAVLDKLKDIIGDVSDKFLEWSKNPLAKAIISGLFAGMLASLGTVIAVSIIPKLISVIGYLTTINLLSGPKGWAVLAVAGITVATTAMASYTKSSQEAVAEQEKLKDAVEKTKNAMFYENGQKSNGITPSSSNRKTELENATHWLESLKSGKSEVEKLLSEALETRKAIEELWGGSGFENDEEWQESNRLVNQYQEGIKRSTNEIRKQQAEIDKLQEKIKKVDDMNALKTTFSEIANGTVSKAEKELAELNTQLAQVQDYEKKLKELNAWKDNDGNIIRYDDNTKAQIDKTVKYLQEKLDEVKLKLKLENAKDWEKSLMQALGFEDKTASQLIGEKGSKWVEEYTKKQEAYMKRQQETFKAMGVNESKQEKDYILQQAQNTMKVIENLMSASGNFGVQKDGTLDNTFTALNTALDNLKTNFLNSGGKIEEWNELLGNTSDNLKNLNKTWSEQIEELKKKAGEALKAGTGSTADYMKYSVQGSVYSAISGTDVGKFLESLETTGEPLVALIETLTSDLIALIGGNEKVEFFLNIIQHALESLSPLINAILNLLMILYVILKPILNALNELFNWLFGDFNKACDDLFETLKTENKQRKENIKDMTSAYESLIKTMQEQEEYYLKKKTELNAWNLKDYVSNVTPVNDMILTPHGNFSTHPNDTIIATKDPSGLGSGGNMKVTINNYSDTNVDVQQRTNADGMNEMLVTISRKIASDVANGYNGWDNAFATQQQRVSGRRV